MNVHQTEQKEVFFVIENAKKKLLSGFLPLKLQLLSRARYIMHKMYLQILDEGFHPVAISTDCIFYQTTKEQAIIKPDGSLLKNLGEYKQYPLAETCPTNNNIDKTRRDHQDPLSKAYPNEDIITRLLNPKACEFVSFDSEKDYLTSSQYMDEAFNYIQSIKSHVFIKGAAPGTGKTTLGINVLKRFIKEGKRILACAYTNERVMGLTNDMIQYEIDPNTMTLCKAMRMTLNPKNNKLESHKEKVKTFDDIDVLLIDEIYTLELSFLTKLFACISKRKDLIVIATGDVYQSRTFSFDMLNNSETNDYYLHAVETFFKHGICLNINKRMTDPKDVEILAKVKKTGDLSGSGLEECSFTDCLMRHFKGNEFVGKIISYTNAVAKAVANVMMEKYMELNPEKRYINIYGMWYHEGQHILNKRNREKGSKRMYNNFVYEIVHLDPHITNSGKDIYHKAIVRDNCDGETFNVKLMTNRSNGFSYTFSSTIHSSQGNTYKDVPITLFGMNHFYINLNDKYTAISRSNSLENVRICTNYSACIEEEYKEQPHIIQKRIAGHMNADKEARREYNIDDYVSHDWVVRKMEDTGCKCFHCGEPYDIGGDREMNWSIDRLDDAIAHTKGNCVLTHLKCNVSHMNRALRPKE